MVSILANLALKTDHQLVPTGGGALDGLTELSRSVAEIANVNPNDWQPYVGRSAFAHKGGVHGAAVAKVERSYQHIDPAAVGNQGRLVVSELGGRANTRIRAEQLGHQLEGVIDPKVLSELVKKLESEGPRLRGRRGQLRAPDPAPPGGLPRAVPGRRLHLPGRAAGRSRAARRGDGQGRGRRRGPPHRGRRQRPGQCPRRGAAQGAARVLSAARRRPPVRLQGPDPRRRLGDGRPDPGDHRLVRRDPRVVDDGQRHEHHRGVGGGPRRFARIRDLEVRRRAPAPRRATLHDVVGAPGGDAIDREVTAWPRLRRPRPAPAPTRRTPSTSPAGPSPPARTPTAGAPSSSPPAITSGRPRPRATARSTRCSGRSTRRWPAVLTGHPRLVSYDVHAVAEGPDAEGRVTVVDRPAARGSRGRGRAAATPARSRRRTSSPRRSRPTSTRSTASSPRSTGPGATESAGNRKRARVTEPTARERRAELDEEAGKIDTTDWFNR